MQLNLNTVFFVIVTKTFCREILFCCLIRVIGIVNASKYCNKNV
jgi:hypothetical protein